MSYNELIQALRTTDFGDTCMSCGRWEETGDCERCIIQQSADAIEELMKGRS